MPRNFKLLDELEAKEKHGGDPSISMGLTLQDDILLTDWTASIFGPGGVRLEIDIYIYMQIDVAHTHRCTTHTRAYFLMHLCLLTTLRPCGPCLVHGDL